MYLRIALNLITLDNYLLMTILSMKRKVVLTGALSF